MQRKLGAARINAKRHPDRPRYRPRVQREWEVKPAPRFERIVPQMQLDAGAVAHAADGGSKKRVAAVGMIALVVLAAGTGTYRFTSIGGDAAPDRFAAAVQPAAVQPTAVQPAPVAIATAQPTNVQAALPVSALVDVAALSLVPTDQSMAQVPQSISAAFVPQNISTLQAPALVEAAFACVDCQPHGRPVQVATSVVQAVSETDQSVAVVPTSISAAFVPPSIAALSTPALAEDAFACVDCQPFGQPVQVTTSVAQAVLDVDQSIAFAAPVIPAAFVPQAIAALPAPALAEAPFTCVDCRPLSQPVQTITPAVQAVTDVEQAGLPQLVASTTDILPKVIKVVRSSTAARDGVAPQAGGTTNENPDFLANYRARICTSIGTC